MTRVCDSFSFFLKHGGDPLNERRASLASSVTNHRRRETPLLDRIGVQLELDGFEVGDCEVVEGMLEVQVASTLRAAVTTAGRSSRMSWWRETRVTGWLDQDALESVGGSIDEVAEFLVDCTIEDNAPGDIPAEYHSRRDEKLIEAIFPTDNWRASLRARRNPVGSNPEYRRADGTLEFSLSEWCLFSSEIEVFRHGTRRVDLARQDR
jgi:hypothetical protein